MEVKPGTGRRTGHLQSYQGQMKKLINRPEQVVSEMCEGFLALNPSLARLAQHNVLFREDAAAACQREVALISGGGSGHEPAHAGFVGAGMLTAAVAGEVFTSPAVDSVLAAIRAVAGNPGVLLIVKNYTGDRLNFGLAAELARAEGIEVGTVIVDDDVALAGSDDNAGRRGIAGTVLVHKIAGAAAAELKDLPQLVSLMQAVVGGLGTMGVSLSAGTSPAVGRPSFDLGEGEIELGLGIHGEPGVRRMDLRPVDEIVDELLGTIVKSLGLMPGERVAALINNLGATTFMELAIAGRRVTARLEEMGLVLERLYGGTFVSSLDMAGISISLLRVDEERVRWLDASTDAPAWPKAIKKRPGLLSEHTFQSVAREPIAAVVEAPRTELGRRMGEAIRAACDALIGAEERLTELDRAVGDGDLGTNMKRAAEAVLGARWGYRLDDPVATLRAVGRTLQQSLGGSSGPLYGVLFVRAAAALDLKAGSWAAAILDGCEAVSDLGGARVGDRTMLDALVPFGVILQQGGPVAEAVRAAEQGAERTASMVARRGRSSYLGERVAGHEDPGAAAVAIWLRAVSTVLDREI